MERKLDNSQELNGDESHSSNMWREWPVETSLDVTKQDGRKHLFLFRLKAQTHCANIKECRTSQQTAERKDSAADIMLVWTVSKSPHRKIKVLFMCSDRWNAFSRLDWNVMTQQTLKANQAKSSINKIYLCLMFIRILIRLYSLIHTSRLNMPDVFH